jgi:hypothetical protein
MSLEPPAELPDQRTGTRQNANFLGVGRAAAKRIFDIENAKGAQPRTFFNFLARERENCARMTSLSMKELAIVVRNMG